MKTIIIYRSKTGFTKKYAKWLAESLVCEAVPYEQRKQVNLGAYDMLIYGGSFHAGTIGGAKWFKTQAERVSHATKIVLAVGAMPPGAAEIEKSISDNFTREEREEIKVFYLPGGLNYENMGFVDRQMMKGFAKMLAGKKNATEEERQMAEAVTHSYDLSDRAFLDPVLNYIQENSRKSC